SNTGAFAKTVEACEKAGGGTVIVPAGTYFTGPIRLISNLNFHLDEGALILFSNNPDDYPMGGFAPLPERHQPLVTLANGHDVIISGKGKMDGQGTPWWEAFEKEKRKKKHDITEHRPKMIVFDHCQRIRIEGVTLTNSPMFHMSPTECQDVVIDGVTVIAPSDSPNTDSCNPSGWNYLITN